MNMEDHLTKPSGGRASVDSGIVDEEVLERVGNDRELLRDLVHLFLAGMPGSIASIALAIDRRDNTALFQAAHALKGSVRTFTEGDAALLVSELEASALANDFAAAHDLSVCLERALAQLGRALEQLVAS